MGTTISDSEGVKTIGIQGLLNHIEVRDIIEEIENAMKSRYVGVLINLTDSSGLTGLEMEFIVNAEMYAQQYRKPLCIYGFKGTRYQDADRILEHLKLKGDSYVRFVSDRREALEVIKSFYK